MGLSRLQNFIKNIKGNIIYVDPNNLDATDNVENQGNSPIRPFITIQRALIEATRFSYQRGFDNDRFERTTIMLSPGVHTVDNRPGIIPDWSDEESPNYIYRSGLTNNSFLPFDYETNFNLNDPNNQLYKFNSIHGGVIVPRGISIVGTDLRKTKIRPLYVPSPTNDQIERSAIFRITGASHFWGFTILDSDPNGYCFKDYTINLFLPNFSHHKLTVFEYADGINPIEINDDFLVFSTSRTDLDVFYEKVGLAYGSTSGRAISPDYPSNTIDIQAKVDEFRIVGSLGQEVGITSIRAGDGVLSSTNITVTLESEIDGLQVDSPIQIQGVSASGYSGQYVVSEVISPTQIKYKVQNAPVVALPTNIQIAAASLSLIPDTVTSASPYIFNVSLRSVYGMCGLHADGSKATGFKSVVVAQFTGIGLQKDDNAFVLYNPESGTFADRTNNPNLYSNSRARFKPEYENYHIKASNDAFIQAVSVFAIGYAEHFCVESGGDISLTNSNSNFGAKSLVAKGFRSTAFPKDDNGYITHIIPPKEIEDGEVTIEFNGIDIVKTTSVGISSHLYLLNEENQDNPPENVLEGYRVGAKQNDELNLFLDGIKYSSRIVMEGTTQTSFQKTYNVEKAINGISNNIVSNVINLTVAHDLRTGETIRIESSNGHLPDGLSNNQVYYVITTQVDPSLASDQIKIAQSLNDALDNQPLSIYSNESANLKIISRVSDKNSGDIGHPIQWDTTNGQWYINVASTNAIYNQVITSPLNATPRTFITRIPDNRGVLDTVYRVRYVLPKTALNARPPLDGYVIQESGDVISDSISEIEKYYNIAPTSLSTDTELRNFRFIANATWASNIATITTELPHNLSPGSEIEIRNIISSNNLTAENNSGYNGNFIVQSVTGRKTFTISLDTNPGLFNIAQTINRDFNLPYFRRVRFNGTYVVYRSEEIQPYISGSQDGIYHLVIFDASYSPSFEPFNNLKFSQPIQNLYPQTNRDNPKSDPDATVSFALPDPIGQVVINNTQNSLTKELVNKRVVDFNVGIGITNAVSNATGTAHTFHTKTDHGLNRITNIVQVSNGFGYGTGSGTGETLYNARLVGFAGSTTGDGATAVVSVDAFGVISDIRIMDGGSAYGIGNTLSVVGVATTTGFIPGVVRVTSIYNNVGDTLSLEGNISEQYSSYKNLYRITGISTGNTKQIQVASASSVSSPSTSGLGATVTQSVNLIEVGPSISVSSLSYNRTTGVGIVTTTSNHGLYINNKVRIGGANSSFYNGNFVIKKVRNATSFEVFFGKGTTTPATTGTIYIYRNGLTSNGGNVSKGSENISGRLIYSYAGITTSLSTSVISPTATTITINNAVNLGFELGDYLQIDDEIVRIKNTVSSNTITVFRGVLGTRRATHTSGSIVRRILPSPIEFRRNSIIRASGHTFEYVGFGPGNYSTALPDRQDRKLSASEEILSQATKSDGGLTVFTGMNDTGDFYIGNKTISSATGKEEIFDTPVASVTGEELNNGELNVGLNIITPDEVQISRSIRVDGGEDNNLISKFNGPVIFNDKITSNSQKGIEVSSLYLQGDAEVSRKQTVGISTPTDAGNPGDIVYNANPESGGTLGWVYTDGNIWERFGQISNNNILIGGGGSLLVSANNSLLGVTTSINFVGTGGVVLTSSYNGISGVSTLTFNADYQTPSQIVVTGVSTFNSNAIFNSGVNVISGISTFNGFVDINSGTSISGGLSVDNLFVTGITTINSATSSFSGDIIVGSTSRAANSFVRVLASDSNNAGFEAYGNTAGTGYLYLGQGSTFGGGLFYNGNVVPPFATGETADTIAFYRKNNGTNEVVFSYPFDSNNVTFRGSVFADGLTVNGLVSATSFSSPGGLTVNGLVSATSFYSSGNANIVGIVTASSFSSPGGLTVNGNLNVVGVITCTDLNSLSDERLKTNVKRIENSIDILNQIDGVEFNWISNNKPSLGVIAQNVEKVLPQLVNSNIPDYEHKSVNYNGLIGVLIEAIKEQQTQINKLEEKIQELENR